MNGRLSIYWRAGLVSVGGASLVFIGVPLMVLAFTVQHSSWPVILMAASYFGPLFLCIYLLAPIFGPRCLLQKASGFYFSYLSVTVSIIVSWAILNAPVFSGGSSAYCEALLNSLSVLIFLLIMGSLLSVLSGVFFIGACERGNRV